MQTLRRKEGKMSFWLGQSDDSLYSISTKVSTYTFVIQIWFLVDNLEMLPFSTYGSQLGTAMVKIKQLHLRLLLRLSKFDRSVVMNLKPISNFFDVYTTCILQIGLYLLI